MRAHRWRTGLLAVVVGLAMLVAPLVRAVPATAGTAGFSQASATRGADGSYALSWASTATTVTVTAGTSPAGGGDGVAVGSGGGTGTLTVPAGTLPAGTRWYFTLTPNSGSPLVVADRSLGLPDATNFRDVGGYRTSDGHWVRMGIAYRSNKLSALSVAEQQVLVDQHVTLDVDLRNGKERSDDPDRIPAATTYRVADVEDLSHGIDFHDGAVLTLLTALALGLLEGTGNMGQRIAYPFLVDFGGADRAYRTLLTGIADNPQATVFHCSSGKDRTGWGAAVLLTLLGVPRATVEADYLASNDYLGRADAVELSWLRAAFDEVDALYGTFDDYLHDGLGLSDATITALRTRFLY
jgi:protein-tyrosine phosphatase